MNNTSIKLSQIRRNEIIKKLVDRFNYDKILNEEYYIKNMSSKMIIKINKFQNDQLFKNLTIDIIQQILKDVPFFKISKNFVKIQYQNSDKILIITGIKKDVINQFIQIWKKDNPRKNGIINQIYLGFWCIFQFNSHQIALTMKKFIRTKKVQKDLQDIQKKQHKYKREQDTHNSYKYLNRRVRIVLLNEDFFTIIVDLMTESMNQKFCQSIESKGDNISLYKGLAYIPLYSIQKIQQRHEEIDDTSNSQILSYTQQIYDSNNRIRDIDIQTNNQGTQIQMIQSQNQHQIVDKQKNKDVIVSKSCNNLQLQYQKKINNVDEQKGKKKYFQDDSKLCDKSKTNVKISLSNNSKNNGIQLSRNQASIQQINSQYPQKVYDESVLQQHYPTILQNNQISPNQSNKSNKKVQQKIAIIQFNQMKRRYNAYIKQHEGFRLITVPEYIRRESESVTYKKKFYHEIIRKAEQLRDSRKISDY